MEDQIFRIKFELFGIQRIANIKAKTLDDAKVKLSESILKKVIILSSEYKETEPTAKDFEAAKKTFDDFLRGIGKFFEKK